MDPISLLVGAGLLLLGGVIGRRRRTPSGPPKATCEGCGHNLAFHGEAGECAETLRRNAYEEGEWIGYEYVPCTCQRYVGHIPADRMLASFSVPITTNSLGEAK